MTTRVGLIRLRALLAFTLLATACQGNQTSRGDGSATSAGLAPFTGAESSNRLLLRAEELHAADSTRRLWRLRFGDDRTADAFDFAFRIPAPMNTDSAIPVASGSLRRVVGANGRALMQALARAFGADTALKSVARADSLRIQVAVLGMRLQHAPGKSLYAGEFTADHPGDWVVTKLFLAGGEVEVFLAVNTRSGEAQLFAKDPDYANAVVGEFARLF